MTRWLLVLCLFLSLCASTPARAEDPPPVEAQVQQVEPEAAPAPRRGKKAEELLVVLVILPGILVLFFVPVGLATQSLIVAYGPKRGRGLQLAQESRGKTVVLGVANTVFLGLVAGAAERRIPAVTGLAWGLWLSMAFIGLHGIARGVGERILGRPPVLSGNSPLKPLALGWSVLVASSALPVVGWCMGLYWLVRGSGVSVVTILGGGSPRPGSPPLG